MSDETQIVALTSGGPHAWIMINALRAQFGDFPVIIENAEPPKDLWRRRRKLVGPITTASMQAARLPIKFAKRGTWPIIQEMIITHALMPEPSKSVQRFAVTSINNDATRATLQKFNPKVVFVISTRMISAKTLSCVKAPFINYHSGINPSYRGMHGGYFALANGEPQHFGATVHLVDEGVDTGKVLYQSRVEVDPRDNFHTYLWRLAAGSREIVVSAVQDALNGDLHPYDVDLPSQQYFSPTLGGYVWTGLRRGVW